MTAEDSSPEDQVRALLAEARVQQPMPTEVVARLDDVLAGLAGGDGATGDIATDDAATDHIATDDAAPELAPVVALNPWRRRAGAGLVAAAAVVLAAVAVPRLLDSGSDSAPSAGDAASDSAVAPDQPSQGFDANPDGGAAQEAAPPTAAPKVVDPFDFALLNRNDLRQRAIDLRATKGALQPSSAAPCGIPPTEAEVALVNYQDTVAALVYLPAVAGKQRVELWTCPGPTFAATLELPAR